MRVKISVSKDASFSPWLLGLSRKDGRVKSCRFGAIGWPEVTGQLQQAWTEGLSRVFRRNAALKELEKWYAKISHIGVVMGIRCD